MPPRRAEAPLRPPPEKSGPGTAGSAHHVAAPHGARNPQKQGGEESWPAEQYLWPLHPVIEWINDKVLTSFKRHETPVITLRGAIPPSETVFLLSGLIPNKKGHPLIHRWFAPVFRGGRVAGVEEFGRLLERTGLGQKLWANTGGSAEGLELMLAESVRVGTEWMLARRDEFNKAVRPRLEEEARALEGLRGRHHEKLRASLEGGGIEAIVHKRKETESRRIDALFDQYAGGWRTP